MVLVSCSLDLHFYPDYDDDDDDDDVLLCRGLGLLALWTRQPDGRGPSTRGSPEKGSDWLGSESVAIPGPITVAHLGSHGQPMTKGRGLCQKKREEGC